MSKTITRYTAKTILFLVLLQAASYGQYMNSYYSIVTPPTPSVYSMLKFSNIPVNHHSGVPSINIPLHTVSSGSLTLPLSLAYHASGIKVAEVSDRAGLGWRLNAGGMISRQVISSPDDHVKGYYLNKQSDFTPYNISELGIDSEPDIFSFNFGGYKGNFVFDKNKNIHILDGQDIDIKVTFSNSRPFGFKRFVATTPDGTRYYFGLNDAGSFYGERSKVLTSQNDPASISYTTTAWLLYKIQTFDKKNTITLDYTPEEYSFSLLGTCSRLSIYKKNHHQSVSCYSNPECSGIIDGLPDRPLVRTYVLGFQLSNIKTASSNIRFLNTVSPRKDLDSGEYQPRHNAYPLGKIELNTGDKTSLITPHFSYFRDPSEDRSEYYRLRLDSITHQSPQTSPIVYAFEYWSNPTKPNYLINRVSRQQDYWGFFNGKKKNEEILNMIPHTRVLFNNRILEYGKSDRNPSFSKIGVLKSIRYPTKGTTLFDYEQNSDNKPYFTTKTNYLYAMSSSGCYATNKTRTVTFAAKDTSSIYIELLCKTANCTEPTQVDLSINNKNALSNTDPQNPVVAKFEDVFGGYPKPGEPYTFTLESTGGGGNVIIYAIDTTWHKSRPIGGLRIKRIEEHDKLGNVSVRSFNYLDSSGVSTGRTYAPFLSFLNSKKVSIDGSISSRMHLFQDYPLAPLGGMDGMHIGYKKVIETKDGISTTYTYNVGRPLPKFFPYIQQIDSKKGVLIQKNVSNGQNSIHNTSFVHKYIQDSIPNKCYRLAKYTCRNDNINIKVLRSYFLYKESKRLDIKQTTQDNITTTTKYTYNNPKTRQPTSITTTDPTGKVKKTSYTYPHDVAGAPYDSLVAQNRIAAVKTVHSVNGIKVDGKRLDYSFYNATSGLPTSATSGAGPYLHKEYRDEVTWCKNGTRSEQSNVLQKTYNTYDTKVGKPSKITVSGWSPYTYTYDNLGNRLTATHGNHTKTYDYYPSTSLLRKATKIDGTSTSYTYDNYRRLKTMTDDQRGVVTSYDYRYGNPAQGGNHVKTTTSYPSVAGSKLSTLTDYDYYDGLGRKILTRKVKQGSDASYDLYQMLHYDNRGRVTKQYEPFQVRTGTGFANPYAAGNASNHHTSTTYDDLDRVLTVTPANWHPTTYSYSSNAAGEVDGYAANTLYKTTTTDAEGDITETYTNTVGKQVLMRRKGADGNYDTYRKYDPKDRPTEVIPPGSTTGNKDLNYIYTYTGDDMVETKIIPDRGMTLYWYDKRNLPIHIQDAKMAKEGKYFTTHFDEYGRHRYSGFTKVIYNLPTINLASFFTSDGYLRADVYGTTGISKGKITKSYVRTLLPDGELGNGKQSTLSYDSYGRLQESRSTILKEDNTTYSVVDSIRYDRADNVLRHRSQVRRGSKTHTTIDRYTIDAVGRQEAHYHKLDALPEQCLVQKRYTAKGQLSFLLYGAAATHSRSLRYNYLPHGWLSYINPVYAGNTSTYSNTDPEPSNVKSSPSLMHHKLEYYKDGNIKRTTTQLLGGNRRIYDYTYDKYDRLKTATYSEKNYNNQTLAQGRYNTAYTYDKRGNIVTLQRNGQYPVPGSSIPAYGSIDNLRFGYATGNAPQTLHESSRAAGVSTKGNGKKFAYDANGNMTYLPHAEATMTYNHLNLPRKTTKTSGNIDWYYLADGTLLSKKVTALGKEVEEKDYISNSEYIKGDLAQVNHAYGRITRDRNCSMTTDLGGYVPSGDHTYYGTAINISGHVADRANVNLRLTTGIAMAYKPTVLGKGGRFVVWREPCSSTKWVYEYAVRDHLGNTRAMFSGDGDVTDSDIQSEYHYYPFGMEQSGVWQSKPRRDNKYRFGGKEVISDLGLGVYNFVNRTYDPALGRFLQVDKLASHPNQVDKSTYAAMWNNPLLYNDPDGNCPFCPWLDAVVDIGFVVYDVGVLAHEKITTGKTSTGNWAALGADVASIAVPMAVGAGLAARAAYKAKNAINAADVSKGLKNANQIAEGRKFEADQLQKSIDEGLNVSGRNRLVPQNGKGNVKGNRTDTDQLIKNDDGTFSIIETKRTSNTRQSKGQNAAENHVNSGNRIFETRTNQPSQGLRRGDKIQVSEYKRINKHE